ncbi:1-acyl-sn-glycerol-3-phosphate acyltransferase [Actinocorallia sp. API 0066]|uniref:lysophospholipid acyltransferase family protein n=1 Tax=Actinocorallia sp. API 0066 TaxID=2896846 RepID=UPI001E39A3D6|nr:lysophospholipid acyltransferase family protein [Actinocorallia sp. API 0066]MCD0452155.1 1-acyl-sn-glycerol-3-phosphate acyltransferase [Actinocorallia sp. API 0066]
MAHALSPASRLVAARRAAALAGAAAWAAVLPVSPARLTPMTRSLLAALGVRAELEGPGFSVPGEVGTLIVANHVSWLDVLAVLSVEPVTMLAKREVGDWPVIGRIAHEAGTAFIDRDGLRSLPGTVAELTALLRAGQSVMAFPEGTTRCSTPGPLRRAVFQAALDAGAPVRPVTLAYRQDGRPSTVAAYVGVDSFGVSLGRVLTASSLTVHLRVHPPLHPSAADTRRTLAARATAVLEGVAQPAPASVPSPQEAMESGEGGGASSRSMTV